MYLAHLNWQQAKEILKKDDLVVVIPIGSTEQHGPVGPLGTDFLIPEYFAKCIDKRTEVLITPTVPFGIATHHIKFAGTIDIGFEGLYTVIKGIVDGLKRHGARKFLFLNGHGGNSVALDKVALEANRDGCLCAQIDWWSLAPLLNPDWKGGHGDGQEVSMIMAIDENLINKDYLIPTKVYHLSPNLRNIHLNAVNFKGATIKIVRGVEKVVNNGGFGGSDSYSANKKWGEDMKVALLNYIVDFINEFKSVKIN